MVALGPAGGHISCTLELVIFVSIPQHRQVQVHDPYPAGVFVLVAAIDDGALNSVVVLLIYVLAAAVMVHGKQSFSGGVILCILALSGDGVGAWRCSSCPRTLRTAVVDSCIAFVGLSFLCSGPSCDATCTLRCQVRAGFLCQPRSSQRYSFRQTTVGSP